MNQNGAAHLLGAKPKVNVAATAFVRHLDANGQLEPESVQVVGGQTLAAIGRAQILDVEELLAAFRQIVREELAAALAVTDTVTMLDVPVPTRNWSDILTSDAPPL